MPILKGTKPRARRWIECDDGQFNEALANIRRSDTALFSSQEGHQTIYRDRNGRPLARVYQHKRSRQLLIAFAMYEHIPVSRVNEAASIYEGGSL